MKRRSAPRDGLRSLRTAVDGVNLHARVSDEAHLASAPTLILVHGLVVSSRYMIPIARRLAPHFRLYAPDLPGFGRSDKPDRVLDLPELAECLSRWMDAMDLERACLLGNSFGCQVIIELAARYPERVERVILAGPTMDRRARTVPRQILRLLLDVRLERPSLLPIEMLDYWAAGTRRARRTLQIALADCIEDKLPYVTAPALVVRGSRDPIVPQSWAEEVARSLPRGRLAVIPGAGHTTNYSTPLELARITRAFCAASRWAETALP